MIATSEKLAATGRPPVIALAGRRVDAPGAGDLRFPPENVPPVEAAIRQYLNNNDVRVLVCSAACGADLLALKVAGEIGIRRRVILPFDRIQFRETSVVDRPGNWGELYDNVIAEVERCRDLVVLRYQPNETAGYACTNEAIVDEALKISRVENIAPAALAVWDGKSRGPEDLTDHFLQYARSKGMPIVEIATR